MRGVDATVIGVAFAFSVGVRPSPHESTAFSASDYSGQGIIGYGVFPEWLLFLFLQLGVRLGPQIAWYQRLTGIVFLYVGFVLAIGIGSDVEGVLDYLLYGLVADDRSELPFDPPDFHRVGDVPHRFAIGNALEQFPSDWSGGLIDYIMTIRAYRISKRRLGAGQSQFSFLVLPLLSFL